MKVRAPLSGVVVSLESVPDPVFARRLVGDGVAIDPTSEEVVAPVSGKVTQLHPSHHALAITTREGIEILVHVGLDTVTLKGRGFTPLTSVGAEVAAGQPVLRFDAETVAANARSLISAVIVTSVDRVASLKPARGVAKAGETVLFELELTTEADAKRGLAESLVVSEPVALPNPNGLHARPAAVLANQARGYSSAINLVLGDLEANAKSVVAIMGLSTKKGDRVTLRAAGPDAAEAVTTLSRLLSEGCGEDASPDATARAAAVQRAPAPPPVSGAGELAGTAAAPGLAIGRVVQLRHREPVIAETGGSARQERDRWAQARREARRQLEALENQVNDRSRAGILGVQLALLDDPDLVEATETGLAHGKSAAFAWRAAYTSQAARLEKLDNHLLRERAADIRDVGKRVLTILAGGTTQRVELPEDAVVLSEEVTPSEMASFDREKLLGLCTTTGSPTSHVAILARNLGIPAICGIDERALSLADGARVVVDGTRGVLQISPNAGLIADVRERIARQELVKKAERAAARGAAKTRDGHHVEVAANIFGLDDARAALEAGADAIGLLRSEFLFHDRDSAPSEEEQAQTYRAIAELLGRDRKFVVRTLDVGGDKPLSYLPLPKEANPFLGVRGIRVSLEHPELFRTQLRAIARAGTVGNLHVMFPMIAGLDELRAAKKILAEELGGAPSFPVQIGAMIEVPSAAAIADLLAREVDFFSIGTNDLTQYTLAVDRGHPKLAKRADALHPAVLRMMETTVMAAHAQGRWVGVCGGIASDPLAVPVLVGLGVDELSVSVPAIASVKAAVSRWSLPECRALAAEVLCLGTAEEIRKLLESRTPALASNGRKASAPVAVSAER